MAERVRSAITHLQTALDDVPYGTGRDAISDAAFASVEYRRAVFELTLYASVSPIVLGADTQNSKVATVLST
jgi:hypothetical protein